MLEAYERLSYEWTALWLNWVSYERGSYERWSYELYSYELLSADRCDPVLIEIISGLWILKI